MSRVVTIGALVLLAQIGSLPGAHAQLGDGVLDQRYRRGDWSALTSVRYVSSVAFSDDIIYFGTQGGIARYDRFDEQWLPPLTTSNGLPSNNILKVAYDRAFDQIYADTPEGPFAYQRVSREWQPVREFPQELVEPLKSIDLTQYYLPFGYDVVDRWYISTPDRQTYKIVGAIADDRGRTWIVTRGLFVWTLEDGAYNVRPSRYGLFHNAVRAMFIDSLDMFFGGPPSIEGETGFTANDRLLDDWEYYESRYLRAFFSDIIRDITGEVNGSVIYMATDHGLVEFDRESRRFKTYGRHSGLTNEFVTSVCLDGDILWVGTDTGIDGIYLPTDSIFHATTEEILGEHIYEIEAVNDDVWIGTDFGLRRMAKPTPVWRSYAPDHGPLTGQVQAITRHGDELYVGSDRGMAIIDIDGIKPLRSYEHPSAIPAGVIYDIAVTDSIVWLGMSTGLFRLVPATMERRMFTRSDGLLDDVIEQIVVDGDYLWLATRRGVNRFRWNNPLRID